MSEPVQTGAKLINTEDWYVLVLVPVCVTQLFNQKYAINFGSCTDLTHECIHIKVLCDRCKKRFDLTCELNKNGSKSALWGYYSNRYGCEASKEKFVSFEKIINEYRKMWTGYDYANKNCKDWSRDFYQVHNLLINCLTDFFKSTPSGF